MAEVGTKNQLFPALNEADIRRRSEVERRLPTWLSQPTQFPAVNLVSSSQDIDSFASHIDPDLLEHLKTNLSIAKLFPVQKCLIPVLARQFQSRCFRRSNDICVSSPTGSGKTLAFVIPIVNYLKKSLRRSLRVLVVLPSKDLAQQVFKSFQQVIQPFHIRCAVAVGDQIGERGLFRKMASEHRIDQDDLMGDQEYASTVDILVATPGALVNLIQESPGFSLKELEILVMDEADKLMINHHHDWLSTVERSVVSLTLDCPCTHENAIKSKDCIDIFESDSVCLMADNGCALKNSQNSKFIHKLLFSATLSSDPQVLMHMNLFQPRLFLATKPSLAGTKIRNSLGSAASTPCGSPTPGQAPTTVSTKSELLTTTAIPEQLEEKMFIIETKDKLYVMWYTLYVLKYRRVICFTNEKRKSFELTMFLNEIDEIRAANFSSNVSDSARQKIINEFEAGKIDVLVATDLAGRGMDIKGIEYVISYDVPPSGTWYAHRVGRTARAGNKGTAITLVDTKQLVQFKKIVKFAHKMPNSMRLSDVVEEMKVPSVNQKSEDRDNYTKTYENFKDKLNQTKMRAQKYKNKK